MFVVCMFVCVYVNVPGTCLFCSVYVSSCVWLCVGVGLL